MPSIDLYYLPHSPFCVTVMLTAEALGLTFNLKPTDGSKGETKTPEFLALNPTHTIPTIVDDGFSLWESRAIMAYLVQKYGKNDTLYPKNAAQRAKVDRLLFFDLGSLSDTFTAYVLPVIGKGEKPDAKQFTKLEEKLEHLDKYLDGSFFAAGNRMTIADISLAVTVHLISLLGITFDKYPNVDKWLTRCKHQISGFDKTTKDMDDYIRKLTKGKFRV